MWDLDLERERECEGEREPEEEWECEREPDPERERDLDFDLERDWLRVEDRELRLLEKDRPRLFGCCLASAEAVASMLCISSAL